MRELINSALVPVMEDRLASAKTKEERERAILSMRVIDPAAGSGHFLLAAARRMGRELARVRTGEEEPSPAAFCHAVRDVIRECIYAVDKNPLAVDLCKVALWIEGHNAGQPLSFLDHHVKCGDSLVGVFDLKVLQEGIPDGAYKAVEGDDKAAATHYRKTNRETKKDRPTLPFMKLPADVVSALEGLSLSDERNPDDVARKEREYANLMNRPVMTHLENACNAWTAAFFVSLRMPQYRGQDLVPTTSTVWERLSGRQVYGLLDGEITKARLQYSFFHWPAGFPDVLARGGFDVVVGNPPYIDSETMTKTMPRQRHFLASCYRSCSGNWDHYIPFVERALDLADSNGTICLLTPTKWLSIPYGRGLRNITRTSFAALLDFSHYRAFEHVGVAAIGNLFRKNSNGLRVTRYSATGRPDLEVTVDRKLLSQHNWGALSSPNLQLLIDNFTTGQTLKDLAMAEESFTVSEAYELKPLVVEQLKTGAKVFRLVTTGSVDPFRCLWGVQPTRYL